MDEHQRRVWGRILERLDDYESGEVGLRKLLADLRGLLDAADLHDQRVINEFRSYFAPLEGEYELRTEPWAPDGLASDERLDEALRDLRGGHWRFSGTPTTDARNLPVAVAAEMTVAGSPRRSQKASVSEGKPLVTGYGAAMAAQRHAGR